MMTASYRSAIASPCKRPAKTFLLLKISAVYFVNAEICSFGFIYVANLAGPPAQARTRRSGRSTARYSEDRSRDSRPAQGTGPHAHGAGREKRVVDRLS